MCVTYAREFEFASPQNSPPSSSAGDNNENDITDINLPGFGYSLSAMPAHIYDEDARKRRTRKRLRFPTAVIEHDREEEPIWPLTYREIVMLRIMNELSDKPDWWRKISDEKISQKWRAEALANHSPDVTEKCIDYCIKELREKASLLEQKRMIRVFDSCGCVVKSDVYVSAETNDSLRQAVSKIEDIPSDEKDYHPGSDDKVVDLVHPSLYPLVYGVTKILPQGTVKLKDCISCIGQGVKVEKETSTGKPRKRKYTMSEVGYEHFSTNFQWLPCNIAFKDDGKACIGSYVNNLHPEKHKGMYEVIEKLIDASIPLWNEVLSFWNVGPRIRIDQQKYKYEYPRGISPPENWESDPGRSDGDEEDDDDDDGFYYRDRWTRRTRKFIYPEPSDYVICRRDPDIKKEVDLVSRFRKQGIQVIVKLANIELTPEKPSYDGGTWHIEGLMNEHICSTALYYYDCENVTDSHLAFRLRIDDEEARMHGHEQNDFENLEIMYNVENETPAIQVLGEVLTCQGRLLAFPNTHQHKVSPFKLKDPTKPGHRKILALFLVDPHIRVISTANVPPQQQEWWAEQTYTASEKMQALPTEVFQNIVGSVGDCPYNMRKAKQYREELMEERRADAEELNEEFEDTKFSFCEH